MVWYGMLWYGVVWCGVAWCVVVWCGVVWWGGKIHLPVACYAVSPSRGETDKAIAWISQHVLVVVILVSIISISTASFENDARF